MITIPPKIKPLLNTLIRYERKSHSDAAYAPKNFVVDDKGIQICHITTLSKIENNHHMASDRLYYELLKKLNKSISYDEELNKLLHKANRNLLKHAEVNDTVKINRILKKTLLMLEKYKGCIIYDTYHEIYQILALYYKDQSFNKTLLDKYIELYDVIPEELKAIFISIAYHYYSRVNIDEIISLEIIKLSLHLKQNSIIDLYLASICHIRCGMPTKSIQICNKGIKLCEENSNKYYLIRIYNSLANIYRYDNPQKAIYYLTMCITNFDKEKDNYSTLTAFYQNLCYLAYDREDYTTILYIYKKHLYEDLQFIKIFFYLLIYVIEKTTNDTNEIYKILNILEHQDDTSYYDQLLIDFYKSIYYDNSPEKVYKNIKKLIKNQDNISDNPIIKNIIAEKVYYYSYYGERAQLYLDLLKNLQK